MDTQANYQANEVNATRETLQASAGCTAQRHPTERAWELGVYPTFSHGLKVAQVRLNSLLLLACPVDKAVFNEQSKSYR